jgi:hypothetical protein
MRENRTYGSEGGEGQTLPDPYHGATLQPLNGYQKFLAIGLWIPMT